VNVFSLSAISMTDSVITIPNLPSLAQMDLVVADLDLLYDSQSFIYSLLSIAFFRKTIITYFY